MIEIPQINLIAKLIAINLGRARLEQLRELMNDPIFAPRSEKDEELLLENRDTFRSLTKRVIIGICCSASLWSLSAIFTRMMDPNFVVPIYVPFSTDTWPRFFLTIAMEHGPICWIGFGHLALDILIGCHYAQATVQLKIIRYNMEHFCDSDKATDIENGSAYQYLDEVDETIKERLAHYVDRYGKVIWFVSEATGVFDIAISTQFLTTSSVICLVIYKLSLAQPGSVEFIFLVAYFFVLQLQVVLYCFFGELLMTQSNFVMGSAYKSEWLLLSPKFRKQLLLAMTRWNIPLTPRVAGVIPLGLNTFITLVRGAFNLFTVLKTTNDT
ncbi:hypothetical protein O0L34_g16449 [Tuta absoluta]|nr:hypothetical protein O0L34_g16449 [Tuta absoluta]